MGTYFAMKTKEKELDLFSQKSLEESAAPRTAFSYLKRRQPQYIKERDYYFSQNYSFETLQIAK